MFAVAASRLSGKNMVNCLLNEHELAGVQKSPRDVAQVESLIECGNTLLLCPARAEAVTGMCGKGQRSVRLACCFYGFYLSSFCGLFW